MTPKRLSQRERALTIYFASKEEKQAFNAAAERLGMTASFLGGLVLARGLETGIINQLNEVWPDEKLHISAAVVKSKKPRPRTKTKKS